jgi:hypothetical protein
VKRKHKHELRMLRSELDHMRNEYLALVARHEALTKNVGKLRKDHDHQAEALSQRGVWNHDYRSKPKVVTG